MRIRFLLTIAILSVATLVLAQQSGQQSTTMPSGQQPTAMPQQSGQQPIGQPTSTPQSSTQQPMTMAQPSSQEPVIKTADPSAFKTSPNLPDCLTSVVERGDPKTGAYVAYVKQTKGCSIPWHRHTASEQVMFVSGSGQFQMKGQQAQTVSEGTYYYIPSQHEHQLVCPNGCSYYVSRDGAADIHYMDAAGNEISPETALAAVGEHPATAVAAKQ